MMKGMVLSGLSVIALVLSLFTSQAIAFTDVYTVKPTTASNSGTANAVWQTFVATCDSIDSVTYFVGAEATDSTANYLVSITDSATSQEVWSNSRSARGWKYQDMGFGVHKPVVRGRTYYLRMSISAQYQQTWNYFYDNYNPYPWGRMGTAVYGLNDKDLAAWVGGVNRVPTEFWGINIQMGPKDFKYDTQLERDTACQLASQAGVQWDREFFNWGYLEWVHDTFDWGPYDAAVDAATQKGIRLIGCLTSTPSWAQARLDTCFRNPCNGPCTDSCAKQFPPRHLYRSISDTSNWWASFVYQVINRYQNKVKYWEVWNEPNLRGSFAFPDTIEYPMVRGANLDSLAKLYLRMSIIVDSVANQVDPTHKVMVGSTSGVTRLWWGLQDNPYNDTGYRWLKRLYELGVKNWGDGLSIHPFQFEYYNPPGDSSRFQEKRFHQDLDSVRALMERNGDGDRPVWLSEIGWSSYSGYKITPSKQADNLLKAFTSGIGDSAALRKKVPFMVWWDFREDTWNPDSHEKRFGIVDSVFIPKPGYFAYKQMTGKLKDKYFNRRVPLADTNVYAFEFEEPGSGKRTWVVWSAHDSITQKIPARTNNVYYDSTYYRSPGPPSRALDLEANGSGKAIALVDSVPIYVYESGTIARPDIIVDSLYTYPSTPRAGDYVFFYARLKNIGNATLNANVGNAVTFQVDGVTKKTYTDSRAIMKDSTIIVGYNPYPPPGDGSIYDWKATWGDHLMRAWVDSSDRYVELREDNNTGYIFKHIRPKVSLLINNNHKYSNHLANDTLSISMNGNTTPLPDSAKLLHEGTWTRLGVYGSRDTLVAYSYDAVKWDSVIVFQGADRDTAGDSIIVDSEAPYAEISSPTSGQMVSGMVPFYGYANDWFQHHLSLWEIVHDCFTWCCDSAEVGMMWPMQWPGHFGDWNSTWVENGYRGHTLVVNDSAGNQSQDTVTVYVNNHGSEEDGFASGFGSFGSSPMNLATDKKGNLIVAETQGSTLRAFSSKKDTLFSFSARRGNDTTGLAWPAAIVCDPETLSGRATFYIADGYGHAIKRFDAQGNLLLRFGTFGSDSAGKFKRPTGIALDWKGRLFVVDQGNHRIQVFDTTGKFLFQFGELGRDSGKMNTPTGIAITRGPETSSGRRAGWVYVTDTKNHQVQVFDSLGKWKKTIKKPDSLGFDTPTGICTDKHGNVFIADTKNQRIVELNPFGRMLFVFGREGDSLCQFRNPIGVASSPSGHFLYVADLGNKRVQRFYVIRGDTLGGGGPQAGAGVRLPPKVNFLRQSQPNPTTGEVRIEYGLAKESPVTLKIYNVAGQVVREFNQGKQKAGYYSIQWDGRSSLGHQVGAGVYFYRLQAGNWAKTRKMIVIR